MNIPAIRLAAAALVALVAPHVEASPQRERPYIYCNVSLPDACFGIADGDELTMKIVRDFILYTVSFSSGGVGTIYYGYNPDVDTDDGAPFKPCIASNGFSECKRRVVANGRVEMLARRDKKASFVHILITLPQGANTQADAFLNNVRACTKSGEAILCAP